MEDGPSQKAESPIKVFDPVRPAPSRRLTCVLALRLQRAGGLCHPTLPLCLGSRTVVPPLPPNHRWGGRLHHTAHGWGPPSSPAGMREPQTYNQLLCCARRSLVPALGSLHKWVPAPARRLPASQRPYLAHLSAGLPGVPFPLHLVPFPKSWGWRPWKGCFRSKPRSRPLGCQGT